MNLLEDNQRFINKLDKDNNLKQIRDDLFPRKIRNTNQSDPLAHRSQPQARPGCTVNL